MSEPTTSAAGLVPVSYHSFYLLDIPTHEPPAFGPSPPVLFPNGLIAIQPGIAIVSTGIASGKISLSVELHTHVPPVDLAGWDEIVEVALETPHDRVIVAALDADLPAPLPNLTPQGPGRYRFRVHARGRDRAIDLAVSDPVEQFHIQAWPANDEASETVYKQTDSYGAALRHSAASQ